MRAIIRFTIRYPKSVMLSIALVSLLFGSFISRLVPEPDIRKWLPHDHPAVAYDDLVREEFGVKERVMIGMTAEGKEGIFRPDVLKTIADLSAKLGEIDGVYSNEVMSLATEKNIRGTAEGMEVRPFMETVPQTEADLRRLREAVLGNDIYAGYLVSHSGNATLLEAEVQDGTNHARLYHAVKDLAESLRRSGTEVYIAGRPLVFGEMQTIMRHDWLYLIPIIIVVVIVVLFVTFRTLLGIVVPLLVVVASVLWTFGIMGLIGLPLYPLFTMIPVILIAIGVADGIHILSRHYESISRAEVEDRPRLIIETMEEMWLPVVVTSVTTSAGFLSLLTSPLMPLKLYGVFTAVGILAAMVFSLTFIPAALSIIPHACPAHYRSDGQGRKRALALPRLPFPRLGGFFFDHRQSILAVVATLVILSAVGLKWLEVDSSYTGNMDQDTEIIQSTRFLDQHFGGTNLLNVIIEGDEPDTMKSPSLMKKILKIQSGVEPLPVVGETRSIAEFVRRMNLIMNANDPAANCIPENRDLIAQYLLLYSISGDPDDFDAFVDYNYRRANIHIQIRSDHSKDVDRVADRVRSLLDKELADEPVSYQFAGWANNLRVVNDMIVIGQLRSLGLGLIAVFLITAASFRSLRAGLFTLAPVVTALLINYGSMGFRGVTIGIATAVISSVTLGVGIDYAVHYYAKYSRLASEGIDPRGRAVGTMATCGRAIFYNALVVSAGFLVLLSSNFVFTRNLAALVCLSMIACFVATITLLPILLGRWLPRGDAAPRAGYLPPSK